MSKDDLNSLGSLYGGMLNGLKKDLIKEGKIGPGEIGDAALQSGGPTEEGGFAEAEVDVEKLTDKEKEDNLYNINKLSYTHDYMPEEDEEGKHDDKDGKKEKCDYVDCEEEDKEEDAEEDEERSDGTDDGECEECGGLGCEPCNGTGEKSKKSEEDEESSQISEKIARDGLNNFMKQKSVFDKLYDKVMVNENFDEMESEDFAALGIEDATPDDELEGDSDEVTVTLSKDVAQALCDVLQAAMGESDSEDGDEADAAEGAFGEEDEEGIDTGSTHSGKYDDGKNNKVGDLKTAAAATAKGADSKLDSGSHLNTSYDDGKNNKVGSLKTGDRAVD
jgi:hypothetical protein